ncbi:MAG TPA: MFS transporter [Bryobacteraceae bacterium]|nr:MFS transporter [Bryobacteraceae bacterium]
MNAYAPFRFRDYRYLLAGNLLASLGLQMLSVAVSWDLYLQTKSAMVLGNVGFVQVTPFLVFALFAGQVADRYDRRRIMVLTQLLLLGASLFLAFVPRSVISIYSCLFMTALARSFQGPARSAVLPHVVPSELLHKAITWNSSAQEISNVGGPAIAGLLLAIAGSQSVYLVQVGCAIAVLFCFSRLRSYAANDVADTPPKPGALLEGVRFVWNHKLILPAMSLDLFGVLFGGATALLPIYAVEILHTGVQGLGWLRAAPSLGAVFMAFLLSHRHKVSDAGITLLLAVAGFGTATVVFGFSRSLPLSLAMLVLTGACDNISVVLRSSLVQMKTPDYVRGRVNAVNNIFISCSNQLGAVESGWTAAWFGPVASVAGGGFATILIAVSFALAFPSLRYWRE